MTTLDGCVNDDGHPELRWLERGEGEPVILLHGLMSRMDHWDGTIEALGGACRAMAPALPIYDARLPEASIAALAAHIVRFLDALEIPRAVIGGNSLGGHVALEVALAHPDRVSGLILTGSSGLFERGFSRGVPHRPTAEYVRQKLGEVVHDASLVTAAWVDSVHEILNTRSAAIRVLRFARAARRDHLAERLAAIRVATLLVWGRDDRVTPPDVAERFRALIPDAELWLLASCGHAPMLEQPRQFNRIVTRWLEATRSRRATDAPLVRSLP